MTPGTSERPWPVTPRDTPTGEPVRVRIIEPGKPDRIVEQ